MENYWKLSKSLDGDRTDDLGDETEEEEQENGEPKPEIPHR